ncbi:MAG: SOS response-associated peptidase [Spirochaetes bacterium]|nr:SOS response-associated peptidase [Spirochaetota bacterium]
MCGRFTQKSERPDIQIEFYIKGWNSEPDISYNVAPSQNAGIITNDGTGNKFSLFRWGLVPFWSKDPNAGFKMINARAVTITQKPAYKTPFKSKRCLVPANGFYEWKTDGKSKIPYYIFLKDRPVFSLAGIFDEWNTQDNEKLFTFSIITTEANELVGEIHDKKRMPVIIDKENRELWLNNNEYPESVLTGLLKPYDSGLMDAYEVTPFVNSPKNNSPECIEPAENLL